MKYLAAYALLTLSGKKNISKIPVIVDANDLKELLSSVQANVNDDDINRVIASLKGKTVHQLIAEGTAKIGGSAPAPAAGGKPAKEAAKKEEPKKVAEKAKPKEEPKVEEEEGDFGLGGGLFD